ncbi:hypothetical protein CYMTET_22418 [Cymbomonas tetramitiformis]|uniref:Uncharacterized protein n=1 Tax=Cymbomonas tetramitiformis TaxID=36881 RepID=A0AAE0L279_9CHLO|nr:hypothetical protein CYMTET_22418 [Cymbomonas tetramitiformis]
MLGGAHQAAGGEDIARWAAHQAGGREDVLPLSRAHQTAGGRCAAGQHTRQQEGKTCMLGAHTRQQGGRACMLGRSTPNSRGGKDVHAGPLTRQQGGKTCTLDWDELYQTKIELKQLHDAKKAKAEEDEQAARQLLRKEDVIQKLQKEMILLKVITRPNFHTAGVPVIV